MSSQEPERSSDAPNGAYSVAEVGRRLRAYLEKRTEGLSVHGEVKSLRETSSGHAYFSLKDNDEDATLDCVMYRSAPVRARRLVAEGARLVVTGHITYWSPRARVQFVVEAARPLGKGALAEALEQLKKKLHAEGLFSAERKRSLPADPHVIGLVTSDQGAALHDVVKVAFQRGAVRVVLAPAKVQGAGAAEEISRALRRLAQHPEVEVIIVSRGGGSADDLSAFNDEGLVRAVAACPLPVVSAVGHEVDVTLLDLVADVRAATPSQAAEMVVPDARAKRALLVQRRVRLERAMRRIVEGRSQLVDTFREELRALHLASSGRARKALSQQERRLYARHPAQVLAEGRLALQSLRERLVRAEEQSLASRRAELERLPPRLAAAVAGTLADARSALGRRAAELDALSPLAVLGRGYAILSDRAGKVLRSVADARPGDALSARLSDGSIDLEVRGPDARRKR